VRVTVRRLRTPRTITAGLFADITDAPVCGSGFIDDTSDFFLDFDGDLTTHQRHLVRIRCAAPDPTSEALMRDALAAFEANEAFLAAPPKTPPQMLPHVVRIARQQQAVIALLVPVYGDT